MYSASFQSVAVEVSKPPTTSCSTPRVSLLRVSGGALCCTTSHSPVLSLMTVIDGVWSNTARTESGLAKSLLIQSGVMVEMRFKVVTPRVVGPLLELS